MFQPVEHVIQAVLPLDQTPPGIPEPFGRFPVPQCRLDGVRQSSGILGRHNAPGLIRADDLRNAAGVAAHDRRPAGQRLQADLGDSLMSSRGNRQGIQRPQDRGHVLAMPGQCHVVAEFQVGDLRLDVLLLRALPHDHELRLHAAVLQETSRFQKERMPLP